MRVGGVGLVRVGWWWCGGGGGGVAGGGLMLNKRAGGRGGEIFISSLCEPGMPTRYKII